jgi:regulatory protein
VTLPQRRRSTLTERRERHAAVDDPAVVLEAAYRFLEVRARSVDEVRRRLTTAGYRIDLVEGAIDRLLELGILDDAAFAAAWVESRDRARPRGERAIRDELRRKGVPEEVVRTVLVERQQAAMDDGATRGGPGDADAAAAERLLARHAHALARVADPRQRRQRAYALLARHGFDPDTCRQAASALVADPPDEPIEPGG